MTMTREGAIDGLMAIKILFDNKYAHEALNMAIEALQRDVYCPMAKSTCPTHNRELVFCTECEKMNEQQRDLVLKALQKCSTCQYAIAHGERKTE